MRHTIQRRMFLACDCKFKTQTTVLESQARTFICSNSSLKALIEQLETVKKLCHCFVNWHRLAYKVGKQFNEQDQKRVVYCSVQISRINRIKFELIVQKIFLLQNIHAIKIIRTCNLCESVVPVFLQKVSAKSKLYVTIDIDLLIYYNNSKLSHKPQKYIVYVL